MPGKTSLTGFKIATQKNRLAATRLVDDAPHRRWVKPPPLEKKARSAPAQYTPNESNHHKAAVKFNNHLTARLQVETQMISFHRFSVSIYN